MSGSLEAVILWGSSKSPIELPAKDHALLERLMLEVLVDGHTGCWLRRGRTIRNGYTVISYRNRQTLVHRLSWECMREDIEEGLVIDHLCHNPRCLNPSHLEPVTSQINARRGHGVSGKNFRKTHCKNGHLLAGNNLGKHASERVCKICQAAAVRKYKARKRLSTLIETGIKP